MLTHRIYKGNTHVGGHLSMPFAKCRCGLVMRGQEEIDAHLDLEGAEIIREQVSHA